MAGVSPGIAARFGAARTVALGLAMMAVAVGGLAFPGPDSGYVQLLPWFLLYGAGAGLLVPLTDVIIGALAKEEAGVASGMLNVSREVFGLLGITVLGAILSARQTAPTPQAFLDAYQFTLLVAAAIVVLGVPLSLIALRTSRQPRTPQPDLVTAA
jgi:MFS family permease